MSSDEKGDFCACAAGASIHQQEINKKPHVTLCCFFPRNNLFNLCPYLCICQKETEFIRNISSKRRFLLGTDKDFIPKLARSLFALVKSVSLLIFKRPLCFCQSTGMYHTLWKPGLWFLIPARSINACEEVQKAEKERFTGFAERGGDSQESRGGKGSLEITSSSILPTASSARAAAQGCGPAGFWGLPGMEIQQGDLLKLNPASLLQQFHLWCCWVC